MDHTTVHALLDTLAESPQPPTSVDIARAAAAGRRTVFVRRLAMTGSAAMVTAAVVVTVSLVASGTTALRPSPEPAAPVYTPTSGPVAPPEQAPAAFDPLVQYADFAWLPHGLVHRTVQTEPDRQTVTAERPVTSPPCSAEDASWLPGCGQQTDGPAWVTLVTAPTGRSLDPPREAPAFVETEPVNGRPARWLVDDPRFATTLQWEYAPGAWAEVSLWDMQDPKRLVRQVAERITFGADLPIAMPLRATGLPEAVALVGVSVSRGAWFDRPAWSAELRYSDTGRRTELDDWPLTVMAVLSSTLGGGGGVLAEPDATLDGHPARRDDGADGGTMLQVYDVDGVYLELATHSAAMTQRLPGGLDQVFRGLEITR